MKGVVDNGGRSLLRVMVRRTIESSGTPLDAWIDTGFTGDLVLPQQVIDQLQVSKSGSIDAVLADGSQIELNTYTCLIEWFGSLKTLEVIANDGEFPLLGVGMLIGLELRIDFLNQTINLAAIEHKND